MNMQFGRLLLAGVCALAVVSAARGDDHPSHVLLDTDYGDLAQQQDLLARRLRHTQDLQRFQDLIKDEGLLKMLKEMKPGDINRIKEQVKNNPGLLDDPSFHDLLNEAEKLKQTQAAGLLDKPQAEAIAKKVENFLGQNKSPNLPAPPSAPDDRTQAASTLKSVSLSTSPPYAPQSEGSGRENIQNLTDILNFITHSEEGKELRRIAEHDLNLPNLRPSSPSSDGDFLEKLITQRQANWLSHNLTLPRFDGWFSSSPSSPGSSLRGAPSGGLGGAVWIVALGLFAVAAILLLRAISQRAADARSIAWSAGPWPVHPSEVSTREDLIRAFEHLAFLRLGPTARPLNHLALADRLGETAGGRSGPAERLAHLYEQARYAPPHELLPADELAAARDDLSTLAGAAA